MCFMDWPQEIIKGAGWNGRARGPRPITPCKKKYAVGALRFGVFPPMLRDMALTWTPHPAVPVLTPEEMKAMGADRVLDS